MKKKHCKFLKTDSTSGRYGSQEKTLYIKHGEKQITRYANSYNALVEAINKKFGNAEYILKTRMGSDVDNEEEFKMLRNEETIIAMKQ
ncbi:adenosine monophosphate-protein transferase [Acrasis kona]|uniref:Adenosine monophosphate-protein transferase n=1 Tax=Acrasis kona TaxID=1008807 RepID=A0AAW2ZRB8_9EUKA